MVFNVAMDNVSASHASLQRFTCNNNNNNNNKTRILHPENDPSKSSTFVITTDLQATLAAEIC